ncbi:N-acetyltransferase family protein [Alteromonadaceae bacterium BrNp21-10]|nr:N-acetyltransferase family protein [Alteromonadaceae bacterium BrNp21-10]
MIRHASSQDAANIAAIYNHFIRNTVITFEEIEVEAPLMSQRMTAVANNNLPWLVYEDKGEILGYAYACPWKERSAYRHSVEVTVYLHPDHHKKGIGYSLYQQLLASLPQGQIHALIAGITLPNSASIALHEKCGFMKVAHFKEVGFKFDQWLDVGYWQKTLS